MVIHEHFAQLNFDLHVFDIVQPYQSDLHLCEHLRLFPFFYLFWVVELWFECVEYYPYIQMWQCMLMCGVAAKPVAHMMKYHLLQWEDATVKPLMNSNMTLTVLNLYEKIPKGATTKIRVKRYKIDITEIK